MQELFIGLMSGTSVDAIDAVLVHFDGQRGMHLLASHSQPWSAAQREELLALGRPGADEIERAGRADRWVAEAFADTARVLLATAGVPATAVRAIGSHGQTIRHRPAQRHAFSWQIGDPSSIAEQTGIAVVADFRRRDIAAGGQGAPLVPAFHDAVFRHHDTATVVLNLGGIANISVLLPGQPTLGYDTGPANMLLDGWCLRHQGRHYDENGAWAATGRSQPALLAQLLSHPYFAQAYPKSTGREAFGMDWLDAELARHPQSLAAVDVQATLIELTARSIAAAVLGHARQGRLLVCGGGAYNGTLLLALQQAMPAWRVGTTAKAGISPLWVEACAFAWLARQTCHGLAGNLPDVTGASGLRVLGGYYPAGTGRALP